MKSKGKKSGRQKLSFVHDSPCRAYWDLYSKWHDTSESSFLGDANFRARLWTSEQRFARRRRIPRAICSGSRKLKQSNRWMTSSLRSQWRIKISMIMKNWIWWWRQHWKDVTTSKHTSERRSVSRSRELRRTTDFSEGDKLLIWSTNIIDLLDPMMKFKDHRDCSVLNWKTTTFRILIYVRSKHCYWQVILHRTKFWKVCMFPSCKIHPKLRQLWHHTNKKFCKEEEENEIITDRECLWNCKLNKLKEVIHSGFRARFQSVWP